jgi:hypothetical protein
MMSVSKQQVFAFIPGSPLSAAKFPTGLSAELQA